MIATSPSPSFVARALLLAVLFTGFGIWGAYDLWVTIPNRLHVAERYDQLTKRLGELEAARQQSASRGQPPTPDEINEYTRASDELKTLSPGGRTPVRPSKFDHVVQWIYIVCLPFAISPILTLVRVSKQRYQLDEAGTLHFQGDKQLGSGAWSAAETTDIDMKRWMGKSVAWLVKSDGSRLKLDAYLHKHLDKIIGAIASRLYPDAWQVDARPVKAEADEANDGAADDYPKGEESESPESEKSVDPESRYANP